jgi:tetratricopeptide (TPR) repeat protein
MADAAGSAFSSKYRIVRLLGTGGMGSVYLARDLTLNRDVAVKFVTSEVVGDTSARRRLVHEAQAAAALDHPCICTIHEVAVEPDGRACIVMQYVEGDTLAERLRAGPLRPREAIALAVDVADALRAAHAHGIIHRDLKPQNIIITPSGRPKLLDFGIAHFLDSPASEIEGDRETHTSLTGPGRIVGTFAYMSPEQIQQRPVDGRSDLFSLGAVVFECLTGRAAFEGRNEFEIGGQVQHADPPPVSSLRPDLTERHDAIVGRLLAKDPADRFQSAEELLGALRALTPDTAHRGDDAGEARARQWPVRKVALATVIVLALAVGLWIWQRPRPLPAPTPEARQWYQRGTESIRNGAYYSGRLALEEAVRLFPAFTQAHARLAETHSELDEGRQAQNALLKVTQLVPDRSRLPADDALTLDAITAVVVRDFDRAMNSYRKLAERRPSEAGGWLDLGRAQESASLRVDARASYERAIQIDSQYAAAHLRLGVLDAQEGHRDRALAEIDAAERLYKAASNTEGETEALVQRGSLLSGLDEVAAARTALERARMLASNIGSRYYEVRAQLLLSSVTASEGRLRDAEHLATQAVQTARDAGLDTVAAEGLIELGTAMQLRDAREAAEAQLGRALQLAEERGASRIAARAKLQSASLFLGGNKAEDAVKLAEGILPFLREHRYRRFELTALTIASRAREDLGKFEEARHIAQQVLDVAEQIKDETQIALALENLAGQTSTLGLLPDALKYRERAEDIHRRQGNAYDLSYDLTNRAELLVRLGRGNEAEEPLREVEAGIAKGIDAYVGRTRRVKQLRALRATVEGHYADAARLGSEVGPGSGKVPDGLSLLASALVDHANARMRQPRRSDQTGVPSTVSLSLSREIRYWRLATRLASGDAHRTLEGASSMLQELPRAPSDELEWRLAALGAIAARRAGNSGRASELTERARQACQRLRGAWKEHISTYETRLDVVGLLREAGLNGLR